jgi:nucleotide-binding universal stress UspA family protein
VADYEEQVSPAAQRVLFGVTEAAKKLGVACATLHVKDMNPAEGTIKTAKERACDVIVMASQGAGAFRGCCSAARRPRSSH